MATYTVIKNGRWLEKTAIIGDL